ncbi:MAG: VCBS repeat-containing protein [Planctomycetes bacterium]|nr:VCBS repeat-containing protein [Planctomycetota bacterium]
MLLRSLVVCGCVSALAAQLPPFAAPVRVHAGDVLLGGKRMFPSPVWHDLDGDGRLDLVVGDLPGRVTVARGLARGPLAFARDTAVPGAGGAPLKFHNW